MALKRKKKTVRSKDVYTREMNFTLRVRARADEKFNRVTPQRIAKIREALNLTLQHQLDGFENTEFDVEVTATYGYNTIEQHDDYPYEFEEKEEGNGQLKLVN